MENSEVLEVLEQVLAERGEVVVPACGFSMGTAWRRAGQLRIRPSEGVFRLGAVVVFRREDHWVAHRILARRKTVAGEVEFITKGDATGVCDHPPVALREVVGVVTEVIDAAGRIQPVNTLFRRWTGWLCCLLRRRFSA